VISVFQFLRILLAGRHSAVSGVPDAIFQLQRFEAELQQDFFVLAARSGKPRGLRWISCEWPGQLQIVADEEQQLISAFAAVNIGFEAVEGGDMEDVEAVSTIRDGSAVFHFQNGSWGSAGRVVFNMDPAKAAEHMMPDAHQVFHREAGK
jgi:hypothetical protein